MSTRNLKRTLLYTPSGLWLVLVCLLSFTSPLAASGGEDGKWPALKGKHFVVQLEPDDSGRVSSESLFWGQKVLREAERNYHRISSSLGIQTEDPWLWERRCVISLYRDKASYIEGTGRPRWSSAAAAFYDGPVIQGHRQSDTFLESELAHEIAHLLFRDYVGRENPHVPRWMDEGVALWFETSDRSHDLDGLIREKALKGKLVSVRDLDRIYKGGAVAGWASHESVSLFYAESRSLMKFLLGRFGQARFVNFLKSFREGRTVDESLRKAYGSSMPDLTALEREWYRSLQISTST